MSKETFAGEPLDPHAAADAIERLRGEVERLTQHNADLVRANQHSMDWFNDALARAEAAERERDEAREFAKEGWANLEIEKLRVQTLEKGDEIFKIRAQCADAISQAAAERDAALARAEAAERERDWHKSLTQSHDLLTDNAALKARAEAAERERDSAKEQLAHFMGLASDHRDELDARIAAAEAKVAKLREALKPFAEAASMTADGFPDHDIMPMRLGQCRDARSALQETEQ